MLLSLVQLLLLVLPRLFAGHSIVTTIQAVSSEDLPLCCMFWLAENLLESEALISD